jgi:phosphatidylserine decarboxylase
MLGSTLTQSQPRWFPLKSSRKKAQISGEIQLQFALVDGSSETATPEEIFLKWQAWLGNFVTTPSPSGDDQDPLSRDLGESDYDSIGGARKKVKKPESNKKGGHYELCSGTDVVGVIFLEIQSITDLPPERNSLLLFLPIHNEPQTD